jgi:hypothetical protein
MPEVDRLFWPDVSLVSPHPRTWRLNEQWSFEWTAAGHPRQRLEIPPGFEFNGASVSHFLEWYLPREWILSEALPHDYGYRYRGKLPMGSHWYLDAESGLWLAANHAWTRRELDQLFGRMLRLNPLVRADQRRAAYRVVRAFGWWAWRQHGTDQARPVLAAP